MTTVQLQGVPETMLWPLHSRAHEATRSDGVIRDPEAIRVYRSIDYPFRRNFGRPGRQLAFRASIFDHHVNLWLHENPRGTVVELACGLETQVYRCDNAQRSWLAVDMPEAIAVREQFIEPTERNRHLKKSALDLTWMNELDPRDGVCVTAQGLLMYLPTADVQALLAGILSRLPAVRVIFDCIPYWLQVLGSRGFPLTSHYRTPPMRWGMQPRSLAKLLRTLGANAVSMKPYAGLRGPLWPIAQTLRRVPFSSEFAPMVVEATK